MTATKRVCNQPQCKAIELKPDSVHAHSRLGDALVAQGQFDEAIDEYRKSIELDPNSLSAHIDLGKALAKSGELDAGVAELQRVVEIDPNDPATELLRRLLGKQLVAAPWNAATEFEFAIPTPLPASSKLAPFSPFAEGEWCSTSAKGEKGWG